MSSAPLDCVRFLTAPERPDQRQFISPRASEWLTRHEQNSVLDDHSLFQCRRLPDLHSCNPVRASMSVRGGEMGTVRRPGQHTYFGVIATIERCRGRIMAARDDDLLCCGHIKHKNLCCTPHAAVWRILFQRIGKRWSWCTKRSFYSCS